MDVTSDPRLVAYCGLYCGACRAYLKEKCPGCRDNTKATWCKVRTCCIENHLNTCADCSEFADPNACRRFNNLVAKLFGLLFRSDRAACIRQIRKIGALGHADFMTEHKQQTIRK